MDLCLVTFKSYVVQWLAKIAVRRPQLKPLCAIYICHPESAKILQKEDGHFGTWCVWCARSFFIVYKNLLAKFIQGFPYWRGGGDGGVLPPTKNLHIHPLPTKLYTYSLPPKVNLTQYKNKNVIFSCSHCSCTIFVLISYSLDKQVMLILILINIQ